MPYSLENPMKLASLQPSGTAKGKISFATNTDGCKGFFFHFSTVTDSCQEANFMGFFHYIYENELTSENHSVPNNFSDERIRI